MHLNPLDFNFLVILNLLIMLVWPVNGYYTSTRPVPDQRNRHRQDIR